MTETTTVSLLDVLTTLWLYPFPHLALFLLIAIPVEAFCIFKNGSKKITVSMIALSTSAVLISIFWSFFISARSYSEGERVQIIAAYPIFCIAIAVFAVIFFGSGVTREIKEGKIYIPLLRAPLFVGISILFFLSALAPYRVNWVLEAWEAEPQNKSELSIPFAPPSLTP